MKQIRIKDFDYASSGMYFVTICTKGRKALFWSDDVNVINYNDNFVVGATIGRPDTNTHLSRYGEIADATLNNIPNFYNNVSIDKYVIMPDHIHMIIILNNDDWNFESNMKNQKMVTNATNKNQVGRPLAPPPKALLFRDPEMVAPTDITDVWVGRIISAPTISTIVGQLKRSISKQIGLPIWQKSFYDRIIRGEKEYLEIWDYVENNVLKEILGL